jgi:hypothetical protein
VRNDSDAAAFARYTVLQAEWALTAPFLTGSIPNARYLLQALYSLVMAEAANASSPTPNPGSPFVQHAVGFALQGGALRPEWDANGTVELNTGEMLHAAGVALDWLYPVLNATARAALTTAIVETGLTNVRAALTGAPPPPWAVAFGEGWDGGGGGAIPLGARFPHA